MSFMCRWFGHKYSPPELVSWHPQFGKLTVETCKRCGHRRVEDDQDRRDRNTGE